MPRCWRVPPADPPSGRCCGRKPSSNEEMAASCPGTPHCGQSQTCHSQDPAGTGGNRLPSTNPATIIIVIIHLPKDVIMNWNLVSKKLST